MRKYELSWKIMSSDGDNIWNSGSATVIATTEEMAKHLTRNALEEKYYISCVKDKVEILVENISGVGSTLVSLKVDQ